MSEDSEASTGTGLKRPEPVPIQTPCIGPVRLVIVAGVDRGRRYLVTADAMIGRSVDCTIRVRDERVSRVHARLLRDASDRLIIEDRSRNRTLVNAETITRRALSFGDKIQVGNDTVLLVAPPDLMELHALEEGRMQAIGYLSAGIAHDLNNLLGTTISSLDYVAAVDRRTAVADARVAECLDDIRAAADRSAELVARVLLFARQSRDSHEPCDVTLLCKDVLRLIRRSFDRKIEVVSDLAPGLRVTGDRSQLMQLLLNLCINARDAMPKGGRLSVSTSSTSRDGKSYVLFCVQDSGVGMDSETRGRIFERFFTTKASGDGTGLGLASVLEVTKWHGGIVEVETEPDRGAIFRVWLPEGGWTEQPTMEAPTLQAPLSDAGRDRTGLVLVVDDDDMLRRSTSRLLRQAGHQVMTACEGREAISMYAAAKRRPELVLLDMDMPGMDGLETFFELRAIDDAVKVLFISGYSSEDWAQRLVSEGALGFLHKPVNGDRLRQRVAAALGET